jgi:predicted site-specific integrase-resolvase
MTINRLQKAKDISDLLQVSESTVIRMAYSGDLPYIPLRSGKRKKIIRFDPLEIEKWLKKRRIIVVACLYIVCYKAPCPLHRLGKSERR